MWISFSLKYFVMIKRHFSEKVKNEKQYGVKVVHCFCALYFQEQRIIHETTTIYWMLEGQATYTAAIKPLQLLLFQRNES